MKEVFVIQHYYTNLNVNKSCSISTYLTFFSSKNMFYLNYHYINENPEAADIASVKKTLKYLESCNKVFERGFLSHSKIVNIKSDVLKMIDEGYMFFTNWIDQLFLTGM